VPLLAQDRDLDVVEAVGGQVGEESVAHHAVAHDDDPVTHAAAPIRVSRTAATFNSGMPEMGSVAALVTRLTAPASG